MKNTLPLNKPKLETDMKTYVKTRWLRLTAIVLFATFLTPKTYGQTDTRHLENIAHRTDLIVEGEVIESESFWNDDHTRIYTSNLVEVKTKMKGELRSPFIEVLTVGGQVGDDFLMVSHSISVGKGWKGLLFLTDLEVDGERTTAFRSSENPSYRISDRATYYYDRINPPAVFHHATVKDIEAELLQPLERFCDQPTEVFDNNFQRPSTQLLQAARDFVQNVEFAATPPETAAASTPTTIEYLIANPELTGTWPKYLEFDLKAKCNVPSTDFAKGEIWVNYNIDAFGPSIVGSGYLTWNEESFLATGDYTVFAEDLAIDKVKLKVEHTGQLSLADLNELPVIEEALLHLKIRVNDLTQLADITFDQDSMDEKSKYRGAGRANALYPYDIVLAVDDQAAMQSAADPIPLEYEFLNETVIEIAGDKWFQADVVVKSDTTTLMAKSTVNLNYSSSVFGNLNDTSLWEIIPNGLSLMPNVAVDNESSQSIGSVITLKVEDTVAIVNGYSQYPASAMYVNTTWQTLYTFRMKIDQCGGSPEVSFWETTTDGAYWDPQNQPVPLVGYSPITAIDTFNVVVCPDSTPTIYSFSPKSVTAGTLDTLSIYGVNFGDSALVWFRSAEIETDTIYIKTLDPHYIYKSDSLVRLLVPSVQFTDSSAATGLFILETAQGDTVWSDEEIEVRYSALNYRPFVPTVRRSILINQDSLLNSPGNGGYVFFPNDTLSYTADAVVTAEASIDLWRCATGVNFTFDPNIIHNSFEYDSLNVIALVDSTVFMSIPGISLPGNALAFTWGKRLNCIDYALAESMVAIMDIDILVNKDYPWNMDTASLPSSSEFDLYSVLIHEVGHGVMLGHSLNADDVMRPSIGLGDANRVLSGFNIEGGHYCVGLSATSHFDALGTATCPTPMIPDYTDCGSGPQGINTVSADHSELLVWPNPSDGTFNLSCECNEISIEISVNDLSGKQVYHQPRYKCGSNTPVSISGLNEGIYVLRTTCDNQVKSSLLCIISR